MFSVKLHNNSNFLVRLALAVPTNVSLAHALFGAPWNLQRSGRQEWRDPSPTASITPSALTRIPAITIHALNSSIQPDGS
ncbi:hypothetical protein XENOCAPTIV_005769 [Xenoophorus captivus]|uniref:Secreted protein n=1 Tax=Xenoophorus captivus TaxID=1517983 RepID=A0ABV0QYN7_9TELE